MKLSNKRKRTFQPVTASIYSSPKSQDTHAWDEYGVETDITPQMESAAQKLGDVLVDKAIEPLGFMGEYLNDRGIQALLYITYLDSPYPQVKRIVGWNGHDVVDDDFRLSTIEQYADREY